MVALFIACLAAAGSVAQGMAPETWIPTQPSDLAFKLHAAVVLAGPNCSPHCGKVLVAGGQVTDGAGQRVTKVSLFDPQTGWDHNSPVKLPEIREEASAVLLPDGRVMLTGVPPSPPRQVADDPAQLREYLKRPAYLFEPSSGTWQETSPTVLPHAGGRLHLLGPPNCGANCGKVLLVGDFPAAARDSQERGENGGIAEFGDAAEIYDPLTDKWRVVGGACRPGQYQTCYSYNDAFTMSALPGGKVHLIGGTNAARARKGTEQFDPVSEKFTPAGDLLDERTGAGAQVLAGENCGDDCGKILVFGGFHVPASGPYSPVTSSELHDPSRNTSVYTGKMTMPGSGFNQPFPSVLLPTGQVLAAGAFTCDPQALNCGDYRAVAELYEPGLRAWRPTGPMLIPRRDHSLILLGDGRVLAAGGLNTQASSRPADPAEIYQGPLASLPVPHPFSFTPLPDGGPAEVSPHPGDPAAPPSSEPPPAPKLSEPPAAGSQLGGADIHAQTVNLPPTLPGSPASPGGPAVADLPGMAGMQAPGFVAGGQPGVGASPSMQSAGFLALQTLGSAEQRDEVAGQASPEFAMVALASGAPAGWGAAGVVLAFLCLLPAAAAIRPSAAGCAPAGCRPAGT